MRGVFFFILVDGAPCTFCDLWIVRGPNRSRLPGTPGGALYIVDPAPVRGPHVVRLIITPRMVCGWGVLKRP